MYYIYISVQEDFGSAGCHGNMRGPLSANINRRFKLVRVDRCHWSSGTRCALPKGKKLGTGIPLENILSSAHTVGDITHTVIRCQSLLPSGYIGIFYAFQSKDRSFKDKTKTNQE